MSEGSRARFAAEARSETPDPVLLCLLAGAEHEPDLGRTGTSLERAVEDHLAWLDRLAAAVRAALPRPAPSDPRALAACLADVLAGREGYHGAPSDHERLESSLLHRVLRRRRGLPIMLSLVWTAVGQRAGIPVYGVPLPGHFVAGIGDPRGEHTLVDPFHGGRPLSREEAAAMVAAATGKHLTRTMLGPAQPLDVVLRVLATIRAWAAARPEHARTELWATDLSLLLPHHPAPLRLDRAGLLVRMGDFLTGAAELEAYAEILDAFDPGTAERVRREAQAARHRLN